ncbi:hypothetical protein GGR56DRAFT_282319 [Xylariaceae sp. FL0804]|nr:hypothetical protein GGR56DRAFT_282319 [Xylariaceae sp. FL0804]
MNTSEFCDPDDFLPRSSPLMKPLRPRLRPSPSPPAVPMPQIRPSQGDAVLIYHLDGGKRPEIAAEAGFRPLDPTSDDDDAQSVTDSEGTLEESGDEEDVRSNDMSPIPAARTSKPTAEQQQGDAPHDLRFLATNALAAAVAASQGTDADEPERVGPDGHDGSDGRDGGEGRDGRDVLPDAPPEERPDRPAVTSPREGVVAKKATRPVLAAPISPYPSQEAQEMGSPRAPPRSQVLMHPNNVRSPTSLTPGGHGELPPIQAASPKFESSASHEALPSIRSQLSKEIAMRHGPQLPHSPPSGPPRLGGVPGSQTSPPISPNDLWRQSIPSPANTIASASPYYSSASSTCNRYGLDYSSASNHETPGTDVLTPSASITDRMSIGSVTNPQVGQFICTFEGCNALPFQTQYLLNSHANVHSSARPHYCPVKGCPRSEGGKGFKRKNEMIRHGLVHDSPGYVCPFCPDREHKYPRPDNLQRHVRVHHVDKDKDDALLRDVLSQRPDGPNRGRRRRGGP